MPFRQVPWARQSITGRQDENEGGRLVNFHAVQAIERGESKVALTIQGTPGYQRWARIVENDEANRFVHGLIEAGGSVYGLAHRNRFFRLTPAQGYDPADGTVTVQDIYAFTDLPDEFQTGKAQMATDGRKILWHSRTALHAHDLENDDVLVDGRLRQWAGTGKKPPGRFRAPELETGDEWVSVAWVDGYFLAATRNGRFHHAEPGALDFAPLDFANAEVKPDPLAAIAVSTRIVSLLGRESVEQWDNAGGRDFAFTRDNSFAIDIGCLSTDSVAVNEIGVFFLGNDFMVHFLRGSSLGRVSTEPVEYDIARSVMERTVGLAYAEEGHRFYLLTLTFPDATKKTWCFDLTTNLWHERTQNDFLTILRYRNANLVGRSGSENIHQLSLSVGGLHSDDGTGLRVVEREAVSPVIHANQQRVIMHSFQADIGGIEEQAPEAETQQEQAAIQEVHWEIEPPILRRKRGRQQVRITAFLKFRRTTDLTITVAAPAAASGIRITDADGGDLAEFGITVPARTAAASAAFWVETTASDPATGLQAELTPTGAAALPVPVRALDVLAPDAEPRVYFDVDDPYPEGRNPVLKARVSLSRAHSSDVAVRLQGRVRPNFEGEMDDDRDLHSSNFNAKSIAMVGNNDLFALVGDAPSAVLWRIEGGNPESFAYDPSGLTQGRDNVPATRDMAFDGDGLLLLREGSGALWRGRFGSHRNFFTEEAGIDFGPAASMIAVDERGRALASDGSTLWRDPGDGGAPEVVMTLPFTATGISFADGRMLAVGDDRWLREGFENADGTYAFVQVQRLPAHMGIVDVETARGLVFGQKDMGISAMKRGNDGLLTARDVAPNQATELASLGNGFAFRGPRLRQAADFANETDPADAPESLSPARDADCIAFENDDNLLEFRGNVISRRQGSTGAVSVVQTLPYQNPGFRVDSANVGEGGILALHVAQGQPGHMEIWRGVRKDDGAYRFSIIYNDRLTRGAAVGLNGDIWFRGPGASLKQLVPVEGATTQSRLISLERFDQRGDQEYSALPDGRIIGVFRSGSASFKTWPPRSDGFYRFSNTGPDIEIAPYNEAGQRRRYICVAVDDDGIIHAASGSIVYRLDPATVPMTAEVAANVGFSPTSLMFDDRGRLWALSTTSRSVVEFRDGAAVVYAPDTDGIDWSGHASAVVAGDGTWFIREDTVVSIRDAPDIMGRTPFYRTWPSELDIASGPVPHPLQGFCQEPDGSLLASGRIQAKIHRGTAGADGATVWTELQNGPVFNNTPQRVLGMAFEDDGSLLAATINKRLWRGVRQPDGTYDFTDLGALASEQAQAGDIALSNDERLLFVTSYNSNEVFTYQRQNDGTFSHRSENSSLTGNNTLDGIVALPNGDLLAGYENYGNGRIGLAAYSVANFPFPQTSLTPGWEGFFPAITRIASAQVAMTLDNEGRHIMWLRRDGRIFRTPVDYPRAPEQPETGFSIASATTETFFRRPDGIQAIWFFPASAHDLVEHSYEGAHVPGTFNLKDEIIGFTPGTSSRFKALAPVEYHHDTTQSSIGLTGVVEALAAEDAAASTLLAFANDRLYRVSQHEDGNWGFSPVPNQNIPSGLDAAYGMAVSGDSLWVQEDSQVWPATRQPDGTYTFGSALATSRTGLRGMVLEPEGTFLFLRISGTAAELWRSASTTNATAAKVMDVAAHGFDNAHGLALDPSNNVLVPVYDADGSIPPAIWRGVRQGDGTYVFTKAQSIHPDIARPRAMAFADSERLLIVNAQNNSLFVYGALVQRSFTHTVTVPAGQTEASEDFALGGHFRGERTYRVDVAADTDAAGVVLRDFHREMIVNPHSRTSLLPIQRDIRVAPRFVDEGAGRQEFTATLRRSREEDGAVSLRSGPTALGTTAFAGGGDVDGQFHWEPEPVPDAQLQFEASSPDEDVAAPPLLTVAGTNPAPRIAFTTADRASPRGPFVPYEENGGRKTLQAWASREAGSLAVDFAVGGTAVAGTDYGAENWNPGQVAVATARSRISVFDLGVNPEAGPVYAEASNPPSLIQGIIANLAPQSSPWISPAHLSNANAVWRSFHVSPDGTILININPTFNNPANLLLPSLAPHLWFCARKGSRTVAVRPDSYASATSPIAEFAGNQSYTEFAQSVLDDPSGAVDIAIVDGRAPGFDPADLTIEAGSLHDIDLAIGTGRAELAVLDGFNGSVLLTPSAAANPEGYDLDAATLRFIQEHAWLHLSQISSDEGVDLDMAMRLLRDGPRAYSPAGDMIVNADVFTGYSTSHTNAGTATRGDPGAVVNGRAADYQIADLRSAPITDPGGEHVNIAFPPDRVAADITFRLSVHAADEVEGAETIVFIGNMEQGKAVVPAAFTIRPDHSIGIQWSDDNKRTWKPDGGPRTKQLEFGAQGSRFRVNRLGQFRRGRHMRLTTRSAQRIIVLAAYIESDTSPD